MLPISSVYIQEKPRKIIIFGNLSIHTDTHSLFLKMQPKYVPSSTNLLLPNNHIGATLFFTQCLIVLFSYSSSYAPLFCRKTRYLTTYLGVRILLCCRNRHVYAYIYIQEKHFSTENGYDVTNKANDKVGYRTFSCSIVLSHCFGFAFDSFAGRRVTVEYREIISMA